MLWDCPAYVSIRSAFMLELRRELGDRFEHFQSLDSFEKSSYVLGSEAWEEYSSGLFKDFVLSVWEERKVRLYGVFFTTLSMPVLLILVPPVRPFTYS